MLRKPAPVISFDTVSDLLWDTTINTTTYERHGMLLQVQQVLPSSIMEVDEKTALAALERSDFVVLTHGPWEEGGYPFLASMRALRPWLEAYCAREMELLDECDVLGNRVRLYARPAFAISGDSGGWITSAGLTLTAPRTFLARRRRGLVEGAINLHWLGRVPGVSVTVGGEAVPASLEVAGGRYRLRFTLDPARVPAGEEVRVQVRFDTSFVPREIGLNADTRHLVAYPPDRAVLLR